MAFRIDSDPQTLAMLQAFTPEGQKSLPAAVPFEQIFTLYTDSTGIPLRSSREHDELTRDIDFRLGACPHAFHSSPSRYPDGHPSPVPMSYLEKDRLSENYHDMLTIVDATRTAFLFHIRKGQSLTDPLSAQEGRMFLRALMMLPQYLANRVKNPVAPQGVIPPAIIVLSNSASGSLGALEGYIETLGETTQTLRQTPDIPEMIADAERRKSMVKRTICAAAPGIMPHFLQAIYYGPRHKNRDFDVSPWFDESQTMALVHFGRAAYAADNILKGIEYEDEKVKKNVEGFAKANPGDNRIFIPLAKYVEQVTAQLPALESHLISMNVALGRQPLIENITLPTLTLGGNLPLLAQLLAWRNQ